MGERWRVWARMLKRALAYHHRLVADPRTPWSAKCCLGLATGYLLLPFDLIPDVIPVLGVLDDLVIVPGLLWLGLRLVPRALREELRANDG